MYFDLHILFSNDNAPTAGILHKIIAMEYIVQFDLSLKDEYEKHVRPAVVENPFSISLPAHFWLRNHSIKFYKDLISILRKRHFAPKEIFMNLEESGTFLSEIPPTIHEEKMVFSNLQDWYFYYLSSEEFIKQKKYKTQLVLCFFIPEYNLQELQHYRAQQDLYDIVKIDGGYRIESSSLVYFIGCTGYFRYISKDDIDPRIITATQQTNEYHVELDEYGWYFIFKYAIDDLEFLDKQGKN